MVDNTLTLGDLKKVNNSSSGGAKSIKQASTFLQDLKGVLEITKEITGVDVMGKFKEVALANQGEAPQSSNAVKIEAGVNKASPVIEKSISINLPKATEGIEKLINSLDDDKSVADLKKEFEENKAVMEPMILQFIQGVTFLQ